MSSPTTSDREEKRPPIGPCRWRALPDRYRQRFVRGDGWAPSRVLRLDRIPASEALVAMSACDWSSTAEEPYLLPADATMLNATLRLLLLVPLSVLLFAISVGATRAQNAGAHWVLIPVLLFVVGLGWWSYARRLGEWRRRARGETRYGLILAADLVWRDFPSWRGAPSCYFVPKDRIESIARRVERIERRSHVYLSVSFRDAAEKKRELRLHQTDFEGSAGRSVDGLETILRAWWSREVSSLSPDP